MVGVPWEQHVAFLDDDGRAASIEARVRAGVRACAGHPAVLCYALGNEIPAPVVRWHGRRRIERFLARLAAAARAEDPRALLTYVNYPTTEYLELPWADVVTFNVYLEQPDRLAAYLARLQNLAGDRPLLLAEIGFDSRRHGEAEQARALELAGPHGVRRRVRGRPSSSRGPTSGTAVGTTSRTGTSASPTARAGRSRRSRRSVARWRRRPFLRRSRGRASPSWSAATTVRGPSSRPWRA